MTENGFIGLWCNFETDDTMLILDGDFVIYNNTQCKYDLTDEGIVIHVGNSQVHQYNLSDGKLCRGDNESDIFVKVT